MNKEKLVIDREFRALIPALTEKEFALLGESLKREGCRDPLVIWQGKILDGHHRHKLCITHSIEFRTQKAKIKDRTEAKIWIIKNQFGRRNLKPFQRCELALKLKPLISEQAKEHQRLSKGRGQKGLLKTVNLIDTEKELATIATVGKSRMNQASFILDYGNTEELEKAREDKKPISHVYTEIKHRIKKANNEAERKEYQQKFKKDSLSVEGEPGARIKYYNDKWGNECWEKRKPWIGKHVAKGAEIVSMGYLKYNPEYKKVENGEAEFNLRFALSQLFFKIKDCERELNKLIKKHPADIIKKAYEFNDDADDLKSAKKYLWPEFLKAAGSFIKVLDKLDKKSEVKK